MTVQEAFPDMIYDGRLYREDVNKISFVLRSYPDYLDAAAAFPDLKAGTWGGSGETALFGDPGVKDEFNPSAFICADDFADEAALVDFLVELSKDEARFSAYCQAPILAPGSRAAQYADDAACFAFLDAIFRRGPHLRRNRSCWGTIYENDLRYYHRLAAQDAQPRTLRRRLADFLR